jgi:hypothetical protein
MFLREDSFFQLREWGVIFPSVGIPHLRYSGKSNLPIMIEPEAVPLFELSRKGLNHPDLTPCDRCGRQPGGFHDFLVDTPVKVPENIDLFRARNNSAVYVVTERFSTAIRNLGLTGFVLKDLPVIDPVP